MKQVLFRLFITGFIVVASFSGLSAKQIQLPKTYMFGFAASFTDTIVHFTDVQTIDTAWYESKSKFLVGRDIYSRQLRNYLAQQQALPHRTCIVVYDTDRSKLEKKYLKMKRMYTQPKDGKRHFDVRYLENGEFRFDYVAPAAEYYQEESEAENTAVKTKKKKSKNKK